MIADECRCPGCGACASHKQRTHLLAQVEKLRKALKIVGIHGPDLEGLVWVSFVSEEMTARAHVVVGDKDRMAPRIALQFREVQRKALEGAP